MTAEYDSSLLRTVHLVPLTALDSQGRINTEVQANHISSMYGAGMRVYLPAAGTSEFQSLTADEVVELGFGLKEDGALLGEVFLGERSCLATAFGQVGFDPVLHRQVAAVGMP